MEIFSGSMRYYNPTMLNVTVIVVVLFIIKAVIFGKKTFDGKCDRKFPCYGFMASLWILSRLAFKPTNEFLQLVYRKYGRTFWLTRLPSLTIFIGDPHLIKLICVQNFQSFSSRLKFTPVGEPVLDHNIILLQNPRWKEFRSALTPIFTSSKMKKMRPQIETCIQSLCDNLFGFAQEGLTVDMKKIMDGFTLDVIAASAFNFSLISTRESREDFLTHSLDVVSEFSTIKFLMAAYFHWVLKWGIKIFGTKLYNNPYGYFHTLVKHTIDERRNCLQSQTKVDLIQLLLKQGKQVVNEETSMTSKEEFSIDEITAICVVFLSAGFETTSTILCSIIFCLAQNPSCQENLFEEIEKARNTENSSADMPYLEAIISESLRLFPSIPFVIRNAVSECHIEGIHFPKDTTVVIPVYTIHRDPEFFPDPEIFRPERFLTRDSNADALFMPFGIGPRNCIGKLFSLMEIRSTLIQLVQNFKFISAQKELKMKSNSPILVPKELFVKIEKRLK